MPEDMYACNKMIRPIMNVCVYVCKCVCVYVCMSVFPKSGMYAMKYLVLMYECLRVCVYVCMSEARYVCNEVISTTVYMNV